MFATTPLRFRFIADGSMSDSLADMSVTYVGRISRKAAEADARRRFQEWQTLSSPLARRWARDQVVVA